MFFSAPCFGGRYGFYIRKKCSVFTKIIRALKPSKIVMQTEFEPMYQIYNMADLNPGSGLKNHTENNI